MSSRML